MILFIIDKYVSVKPQNHMTRYPKVVVPSEDELKTMKLTEKEWRAKRTLEMQRKRREDTEHRDNDNTKQNARYLRYKTASSMKEEMEKLKEQKAKLELEIKQEIKIQETAPIAVPITTAATA